MLHGVLQWIWLVGGVEVGGGGVGCSRQHWDDTGVCDAPDGASEQCADRAGPPRGVDRGPQTAMSPRAGAVQRAAVGDWAVSVLTA